MGGLLTRYYLRHEAAALPEDGSVPPVTWAGAAHVSRAILIGTPNAGSTEALIHLTEGRRFAPILPRYPAAVLGTMPSIYQLLLRARHGAVVEDRGADPPGLDVLDPGVWQRFGWGLAAAQDPALAWLLPDVADPAVRRRIARDHLRKALARARQFHAALDQPAAPPPGLDLHLFAGDAKPTAARLAVDPTSGKVTVRERPRALRRPATPPGPRRDGAGRRGVARRWGVARPRGGAARPARYRRAARKRRSDAAPSAGRVSVVAARRIRGVWV
jgi:hypothetical protein